MSTTEIKKSSQDLDVVSYDPTFSKTTSFSNRSAAGIIIDENSQHDFWHALHPLYGQGGSSEYPLREMPEKRIKGKNSILKLRNSEVRIEPTNLCNYTCVMCPRDTHDRPKGYMPMEFFKSVVDEVVLMGAQQITLVNFGEPFVDPTLEDKIFYCSQLGLRTYVISNASLFHLDSKSEFAKSHGRKMSKIEAAVLAGLSELRLSFYGADKETYENIMVRGDYDKTVENINLMKKVRSEYGATITSPTLDVEVQSPEVSMYFLEFEESQDNGSKQMQDFLSFAKDYADYTEVWRPHNFGAGRSYRDSGVPDRKTCGRPFSGPLQINWKGIVVPCCYDYNEDLPLGNVALQTVEEVVRGKPYEELRRAHRDDFSLVPYCDSCDQLCPRNDALVVSSNPKHEGRSKENIMMSPNTAAGFVMNDN